jgi:dihydrofolate synthase / folylpolyglutamate synthase
MTSLADWLERIAVLRSGPEIEMGLERIRPIYERMDVAPSCPVILVAGTNGKGSVCAYLDAILRAGGFHVARYTSPHLHRFNERIVVDGVEASDAQLVAAFDAVEAARGEMPLTFFEYTTLAAFQVFSAAKLDAWVIEVGLGGRLDATNILDADCAVITSIGIDHTEFLGATRELIAVEKAGILRAGRPAVIAEPHPPVRTPGTWVATMAGGGRPIRRINGPSGPSCRPLTAGLPAATVCPSPRFAAAISLTTPAPRWLRCSPCATVFQCRKAR